MLSKLFRHIGRQSKPVRNRYAMVFAGTFTGLIALIWFIGTNPFSTPMQMANKPQEQSKGTFYTLTKQIKEQVAGLNEAISNEVDDSAENNTENQEGSVEIDGVEETQPNVTEIKLSQEDIKAINNKSSTTISSNAGSSTLKYQEVLIATTSSAKVETSDQKEEELQ